MSIKRFTALILSLLVAMGAFSSCIFIEQDLQSDTYVVNVRMVFATNDEKMKDAVDAMSASAVLSVDHGDISMEAISTVDDIAVKKSYVYVGETLYHSNETSLGDMSVSEYEKATATKVDVKSILSQAGAGASIGLDDFDTHEVYGSKGVNNYFCSDINEEAGESLCNIMASKFEGLDATVILTEASYSLDTESARNVASVLSCSFKITMNGTTYEITVHTYCDYDYDAEVSISAPADTEKYADVSYKDIIG